uniref:hypothetical protein n=1 Tax=Agathobacter sp. TaxID=2021311 RepID=UPI0040569EED
MSRKRNYKKITYFAILFWAIIGLWGCVPEQEGEKEDSQVQQEAVNTKETLYLILGHDAANQALTMYSYEDGNEYEYAYATSTLFKDKYDKITSEADFLPGKVVSVGKQDRQGCLMEVKASPDVWVYENISRFSINQIKGVFEIADTKYAIDNQTTVFSNDDRISMDAISENDILTVVGKEKHILSVIVTTGQGTLALMNTELFEGSYMQLNGNIFEKVTEDMEMELPEGKYVVKVANDGWGGSCELEIVRGETTTVDLDTLKGEGRKKGFITFEVGIENVAIEIDGEEIDYSQPTELTYGIHTIAVAAEGYSEWKRYLNVNSEEATIEIELEEESEKTGGAEETEGTESPEGESEDTEDVEELLEEALNEVLESNIITGY